MSITYVGAGTTVYSTSNPAPTAAPNAIGDLLILLVGTKPDTTPATTPSGWTLLGAVSGGIGSTAADTGPMRIGVFYKVATSANEDAGAITVTGNNVTAASIYAFRSSTGATLDIVGTGAADTTAGTAFTATMPVNIGLTVGDQLLAVGVIPTDVQTPSQFTAETVSAPGMTTVTLTELEEWDTTSGFDMGGWVARGSVVTGTSTGAPTVSSTASGTTTNVAGPLFLVRMREQVAATPKSASDSGTLSVTGSASVVKTDPPPGLQAPWVGAITPGDNTGPSGTSGVVSVAGATDGQVVFIFGTLGDSQTAALTPPTGWNDLGQTSEGTSGGSSSRTFVFWKVKSSGDTNVTINWSVSTKYEFVAMSWPGVSTSTPSEGLSWLTHTSGTSYVTGTSTPTDTNRWAVGIFSARGSTAIVPWALDAALTSRAVGTTTNSPFIGLAVGDSNGPVTATAKTYTSTGQSASHGLGGVLFLIPGATTPPITPDVFVTGADSGTHSVTETASTAPYVANLPGFIGGVEPESHSHNPPLLAPNGSLYRITESSTESGNHPMAWKSADGGATWIEMDSANRPTAQDMEGSWVAMDGTTLIFTVTRDDQVWWTTFNTTTDTWASQETIDSGLSSSGVEQYSSFVKNDDGTFWVFYSDTLSGSNQQIAYKKRTGTNTYTSKLPIGPTTSSNIAPSPVKGASDLTHVFYKDDAANTVYWRTLTTTGTLSSETAVATGTATDNIPHTNSVYVDNAGVEEVSVAYATNTDMLRLARVVGGVVQSTEAISANPITMDPGSVTNGGTVAHLASYGGAIHAIWSDAATGDVLYRKRGQDGFWESISTLWSDASLDAWYTYNNIYVRGGVIIMGYVYDRTHGLDVSDLWYNEVNLGSASTTTTKSAADTGTLSVTESSTLFKTFDVNDTGTLSVTDASTVFKTIALSDTGTLSVTDSSTMVKNIALTDTGTHSTAEASVIFNDRPAADAGVLSVVETASVVVSGTIAKSAVDTGTFSVSETAVVTISLGVSDTGTVSATESSTNQSTLARTDTGTLSTTEDRSITVSVVGVDSGTHSVTDTSAFSITAASNDTGTHSVVESRAVTVTGATSDTGTLSVTESATIAITSSTSDAGTLSVIDTSIMSKFIALSDTGTHSVSDSSSKAVGYSIADTGTLSVTESSSLFINDAKDLVDSGTHSVVEGRSISGTATAADTGTLSVNDTSTVFKTIAASDSGTVSVTEVSVVFNDRPTTDAGTHTVTESSSVFISGGTSISASDTATHSVAESRTVAATSTRADTGTHSATESLTGSSTADRGDTGSLSVVETAVISISRVITDSGTHSVAETASVEVFSGTNVKVWTGTAWATKPMRRWDGTQFVDIEIRRWDGNTWV